MVELVMTSDERRALEAFKKNMDVRQIRSEVFNNKFTRQAVWETLRRAQRKEFRFESKARWVSRPEDCPIDELPFPTHVRKPLERAGFRLLGDLAGTSEDELAKIPRIGKAAAHVIYQLVNDWNVKKAKSFCPNCGKAYAHPLEDDGKTVRKCRECRFKTEIKVLDSPPERELVAASA